MILQEEVGLQRLTPQILVSCYVVCSQKLL